jgi:hypothetical protein
MMKKKGKPLNCWLKQKLKAVVVVADVVVPEPVAVKDAVLVAVHPVVADLVAVRDKSGVGSRESVVNTLRPGRLINPG